METAEYRGIASLLEMLFKIKVLCFFYLKILHHNNNNNNKSLLCHACEVFGFGCVLFQNKFLGQAVEGF
jgi:hypothetical protein